MYQEISAKSALHELKRKIPYHWDLNIYRGCSHGCKYCYAAPTHSYVGSDDFQQIMVKKNIAEVLERELATFSQREIINIGGVTDSYQQAEAEYKLMPDILRLLIKHRVPAIISTKSDLILRDYDLIAQLARLTYVNVAQSITTTDESLRKLLEPGASPTENRLKVVDAFAKTKASTGIHLMPILPGLTDSLENLEKIISRAKSTGVDYILPGTLYFTKGTKGPFIQFLAELFPDQLPFYEETYSRYGASKSYKERLYQGINSLRQAYGCTRGYMEPIKNKLVMSDWGTYQQLCQ